MRLRTGLLLVLAATVAPLLAFATFAVSLVTEQVGDSFVNAALARNRATLATVDARLSGTVDALRILSDAASLRGDDLHAFHRDAQAALDSQAAWQDVILYDPQGRQLVNARLPWGARLPTDPVDRDSFDVAVKTRQPAYGNLAAEAGIGSDVAVAVRLPLLRSGQLAFVLTARLRPSSFQEVLETQKLPANWISGLVGRNGRFVARIPQVPAGRLASDDYRAHIAASVEGWYRGRTLEGVDTYTAHSRSDLTGWSIGLAVPAGIVIGGPEHAARLMLLGLLASSGVALLLSIGLMRRITRPMKALEDAAEALGRGSEVSAVETRIQDIARISRALIAADRAVGERDAALLAIQEELRARTLEAQTASDNKSKFLALVSHELRNPLFPLKNGLAFLRLKLGAGAHANLQPTLDMMERQSASLTRLIDDLLDLGRIDRGEMRLHFERMDLAEAVDAGLEAARPGLDAKRHRVTRRQETGACLVKGDALRLAQVFSNLLNNAARYTPDGGHVVVVSRQVDGFGEVSITDDGVGFAPEDATRIFEMFVRVGNEENWVVGSLGIGLSVARALVEAHGGAISASSPGVGLGATFVVRLPLIASGGEAP